MDPRHVQASSEEDGFVGMVDEFILFGGTPGFNDQFLSQSLSNSDISGIFDAGLTTIPHLPPNDVTNAYQQDRTQSLMPPEACPSSLPQPMSALQLQDGRANDTAPSPAPEKHRCWDHGCNGREFSSKSNLMRHSKEKSDGSNKCSCPLCGAIFTRTSARDTHVAKQSCNKIRRYSNGRPRPSRLAMLENPQVAALAAASLKQNQDEVLWQQDDWATAIACDPDHQGGAARWS